MGLFHAIFLPLKKDIPILDAGGGTGIWSIELAEMGYHVVLTDISRGMLNKAKRKVSELKLERQIEIRTSDIRNMPEFEDNKFTMVIYEGDPLSYCGDHNAAIRELVRLVQRGGIVIASVDNRLSWVLRLGEKDDHAAIEHALLTGDVTVPQKREEFSYTVHTFTLQELHELFESNGLSVERIIGKPVISHNIYLFQIRRQKMHITKIICRFSII